MTPSSTLSSMISFLPYRPRTVSKCRGSRKKASLMTCTRSWCKRKERRRAWKFIRLPLSFKDGSGDTCKRNSWRSFKDKCSRIFNRWLRNYAFKRKALSNLGQSKTPNLQWSSRFLKAKVLRRWTRKTKSYCQIRSTSTFTRIQSKFLMKIVKMKFRPSQPSLTIVGSIGLST